MEKIGQQSFAEELLPLVAVGTISDVVPLLGENRAFVVTMPADFISFDHERVTVKFYDDEKLCNIEEVHGDYMQMIGGKLHIFVPGTYEIGYNGNWLNDSDTDDYSMEMAFADIPNDVAICIPSYIVSQIYKIDDDYKAQVFRNEFEMMLARIDPDEYQEPETFKIMGDW